MQAPLWTLTGANTIADVTDNGGLTIAGSLDVSAAVNSASAGQFDLQSGGSLEVAADTAADSQIDFLGASQLTIDNAALFGTGVGGSSYAGPLLENFAAGDTIDLHGFMTAAAALLYNPAKRTAPDHQWRKPARDCRFSKFNFGDRELQLRLRRKRRHPDKA